MSNNLFLDSLNYTQKVFEYGFEQAVEQEILLADYDEAVFKIVKTNIEHSITQKYISANKLVLDGYFKLSVYYQPPESETLAVTTQKIPFQKQIEIQNAIEDLNFVFITGETQFINTRAIHPTRIEARGAYHFTVKIYKSFENPLITAINSKTVCADDIQIDYFTLQGQGIRQFNIEDEIDLDEDLKQIINVTTQNMNMSTAVYKDKVNVKGEVKGEIWYTKNQTSGVFKTTQTFNYNQIIDIDAIDENNIAYTQYIPLNLGISQSAQTQKNMCTLTAQLDAKVFKRQQVLALRDAFSRKYEYETKTKTIVFDENLKSINKNINIGIEESLQGGYSIVHSFASIVQLKTYFEENNLVLKAKVVASIIVKNLQNEYECITKAEDYVLDTIENVSKNDEYLADAKVISVESVVTDDKLKINLVASLDGFMILRNEIKVLDEFQEDTEKALVNKREALILYYAQKDENLFEIASKYRISAQSIMQENEIDTKIIKEDKMLFIPAFDN